MRPGLGSRIDPVKFKQGSGHAYSLAPRPCDDAYESDEPFEGALSNALLGVQARRAAICAQTRCHGRPTERYAPGKGDRMLVRTLDHRMLSSAIQDLEQQARPASCGAGTLRRRCPPVTMSLALKLATPRHHYCAPRICDITYEKRAGDGDGRLYANLLRAGPRSCEAPVLQLAHQPTVRTPGVLNEQDCPSPHYRRRMAGRFPRGNNEFARYTVD